VQKSSSGNLFLPVVYCNCLEPKDLYISMGCEDWVCEESTQRPRVNANGIRTRKRSKERPSKEGKLQNRPILLYWVFESFLVLKLQERGLSGPQEMAKS